VLLGADFHRLVDLQGEPELGPGGGFGHAAEKAWHIIGAYKELLLD
jgi:hypothetical protein